MSYQFPPDVEQLIRQQMSAGGYSSEDELLRDALQALDDQRHMMVADDPRVVEGVRRGLDEMQQGLGQPFEEFAAEFKRTRNIRDDD